MEAPIVDVVAVAPVSSSAVNDSEGATIEECRSTSSHATATETMLSARSDERGARHSPSREGTGPGASDHSRRPEEEEAEAEAESLYPVLAVLRQARSPRSAAHAATAKALPRSNDILPALIPHAKPKSTPTFSDGCRRFGDPIFLETPKPNPKTPADDKGWGWLGPREATTVATGLGEMSSLSEAKRSHDSDYWQQNCWSSVTPAPPQRRSERANDGGDNCVPPVPLLRNYKEDIDDDDDDSFCCTRSGKAANDATKSVDEVDDDANSVCATKTECCGRESDSPRSSVLLGPFLAPSALPNKAAATRSEHNDGDDDDESFRCPPPPSLARGMHVRIGGGIEVSSTPSPLSFVNWGGG